jgi:hypothetical protein
MTTIDGGGLAPGEHGIAGELGAMVGRDHSWLATLFRYSTIVVSSRANTRPEIDVSGMAPRHSLVMSSTMLRLRKRRPLANRPPCGGLLRNGG